MAGGIFNHGNAGALVTDRSGRTFRVGSLYDPVPDGGARADLRVATDGLRRRANSDDGHVYVGGFAFRMNPDGTNVEVDRLQFPQQLRADRHVFGDVFHNDNDDPPASRTSFLMEYGNLGFFSRDGRRTWNADRRPGQSIPDRRVAAGGSRHDPGG